MCVKINATKIIKSQQHFQIHNSKFYLPRKIFQFEIFISIQHVSKQFNSNSKHQTLHIRKTRDMDSLVSSNLESSFKKNGTNELYLLKNIALTKKAVYIINFPLEHIVNIKQTNFVNNASTYYDIIFLCSRSQSGIQHQNLSSSMKILKKFMKKQVETLL